MNGLTPVRTIRLLSSCFAVVGVFFLAVALVVRYLLSGLVPMAQGMVRDGLSLYNSFSGRLAVANIAGHKELLGQLKEVKGMLPSDGLISFANVCIPLLIVLAVVLLGIAVLGMVKPMILATGLVRIKLLKWTGDGEGENGSFSILETVGQIQLKTLALPAGVLAGVILLVVIIRAISGAFAGTPEEKAMDLEKYAVEYVNAQKSYFNRTKMVGDAAMLEVEIPSQTDYFEYNVTRSQFVAILQEDLGGCPAGSQWTISAKAEGLFSKELKLFRKPPADTNCVKLLPDFRNVGRVRPSSVQK